MSPALSLQDIAKRRQQTVFIGREEHLELFRTNMAYALDDENRQFIINVYGPGGVGKTWLLQRFQELAESAHALTLWTNETEHDAIEVLDHFAQQLEAHGHILNHYRENISLAPPHAPTAPRHDADASPPHLPPVPTTPANPPATISAALSEITGSTAGIAGRDVKQIHAEAFYEQAIFHIVPSLSDYAFKLSDKILEPQRPSELRTSLFLVDLRVLAEQRLIVLFFDGYERTCKDLDEWLLNLLDGRYGIVPANVLFVLGGQAELDHTHWASYEGLLMRLPLHPFTPTEAREFLRRKHIHDERVCETILSLCGGLPLLLATLATESPHDPTEVGDPSSTAVDCFLKWVADPILRTAAVHAALPRVFNRDVLAILFDEQQVDIIFAWLKTMPFVREQTDGWIYHDVVRAQMLRHQYREAPRAWAALHSKLHDYYEQSRQALNLDDTQGRKERRWQDYALAALYHRICQASQRNVGFALNGFLAALKVHRAFARRWAEVLERSGRDAPIAEIDQWGRRLREALTAYEDGQAAKAVPIFSELVDHREVDEVWRSVSFAWCGELYQKKQNYTDAIANFDRAIALDPDYTWAIAKRGETYSLMARYAEALANFDRAVALNPDYRWVLAARGETYRLMQRYSEALTDFDRAIALSPDHARALADRGAIYLLMQRYPEALSDFDRAIALNPDYTWAIMARGQTYVLMQRYPEALADFDRAITLNPGDAATFASRGRTHHALQHHSEALADFDRAIALDPDDDGAFAWRGQTHHALQHHSEALADFDRVIVLNPNSAWAIAVHGETYWLMQRYFEALADFDRAIALDPDYAWAIANRGITYRLMRRYPEALADFDRAIALDSNSALAFASRGETHRLMQRYSEALADFNRAIALDPDYAWAIASRGVTYRFMQRYPEALADFDRAIALDPNDYAAVIAARGITYRLMQRYLEALADLDRAIALDPNSAWAIASRGETYRLMQRYPEALADFDRAIALDPNFAWTLASRGQTHYALQRYPEALADFDRTIALNPDDAWAIAWRGETYRLMERYPEALADFDRAIALNPDDAWAIAWRGETYLLMQCYPEALADFDRAIALDPDDAWAIASRGQTLCHLGRYEESIQVYQHGLQANPTDYTVLYNIAVAFVRWKGLDKAQLYIVNVRTALIALDVPPSQATPLYVLGGLEALAGNDDKAITYLAEAARADPATLEWARNDVAWLDMRTNPRFQALLASRALASV